MQMRTRRVSTDSNDALDGIISFMSKWEVGGI